MSTSSMATLPGPSTSTITTVNTRKRKRCDSLVIHLSSPSPSFDNEVAHTESEFDPCQLFDTSIRASKGRRRYACTFQGCTKSYAKPSRLEEHERSHTGDRPYVCKTCSKSYLRETHLQAHARTHLPSSAKPFACEEEGCGKRFWTSQHLRVHSELHRGEKTFKCTEPKCDAAFNKHHQLRDHIATLHSPPGTKPYRCEHSGCTKSFATNQKLTAHAKTHDDKRYTCAHKACLPAYGSSSIYYSTWSALQHHTRTAHPPTCPYPECSGKTFTQQKGLRAHLKIHAQRGQEATLDHAEHNSGSEDEPPRKKRRGGEVGRDWVCEEEGCTKDFKSKKALATHYAVTHLGKRDFVCPHVHCARAFGYKHLLQRHLAKLHAPKPETDAEGEASSETDREHEAGCAQEAAEDSGLDIDILTGRAYAAKAQTAIRQARKLQCPHPHLPPTLLQEPAADATSTTVSTPPGPSTKRRVQCEYVFSRAYDLRRHLQAEHGVEIRREKLDEWVQREKERTSKS